MTKVASVFSLIVVNMAEPVGFEEDSPGRARTA